MCIKRTIIYNIVSVKNMGGLKKLLLSSLTQLNKYKGNGAAQRMLFAFQSVGELF